MKKLVVLAGALAIATAAPANASGRGQGLWNTLICMNVGMSPNGRTFFLFGC